MSTTRWLVLTAVALVALSGGHGAAQPTRGDTSDSLPIPPEAEAMKAKRERAHAVLDALTAGDYDVLRRNAEGLALIADMRVFVARSETPEYRYQARAFKHAADDLAAAAKAKNIDAAALAYGDMTRTCVKCHTEFRGVKK
jgi:cytochrome c556